MNIKILLENRMKIYSLIALMALSITPLNASLVQEVTQGRNANRCKVILKEIEDTQKMLSTFDKVASNAATKRNYEKLLADLLRVYKEASSNEHLDVEQEIKSLHMKSFYAENFY